MKGQPSSNEDSQTGPEEMQRCLSRCGRAGGLEWMGARDVWDEGTRIDCVGAGEGDSMEEGEGYGLELVGSIWRAWLVGSHFRA